MRSHTIDTNQFPHFTSLQHRHAKLNMNLFEKFRLNFLKSAFVSRSLFRFGRLFHRFFCFLFFIFFVMFSFSFFFHTSLLFCRIELQSARNVGVWQLTHLSGFLVSPVRSLVRACSVLVCQFLVFNCFNRFNRPFCVEFVQVQMHSSLKRIK